MTIWNFGAHKEIRCSPDNSEIIRLSPALLGLYGGSSALLVHPVILSAARNKREKSEIKVILTPISPPRISLEPQGPDLHRPH